MLLNNIKVLLAIQKICFLLQGKYFYFHFISRTWVQTELQNQTAQPSNVKTTPRLPVPPKVLIEQIDMHTQVFQFIVEKPQCEIVILLYLQSLCKHNISAQEDLSKMCINELIRNKSFDTLRRLVEYSLLTESKAIACYLLSHSNEDCAVSQVALNMLSKIKAYEIAIEVLLGQGKVIDALRLAINTTETERISARKFLEAAQKSKDDITFYSVFKFFQMRNVKQFGSTEFQKSKYTFFLGNDLTDSLSMQFIFR